MRARKLVNLRVFDDADEKDILFGPSDETQVFAANNFTEEHSDRFRIAASGSLDIGVGSIGLVAGFHLRVLGDCDVTINGAAAPIQIRRWAGAQATVPANLYIDGPITSVVIDNISATAELVGYFCMFGDAS